MLHSVRDVYLEAMGITQWQLKTQAASKPYLFLLDEALNDAKNQLLDRLLQAMKWTKALTHIEVVTNNNKEQLEAKIASLNPQKVVVFGERLSKYVQNNNNAIFAAIPAVSTMLEEVEAKKLAWNTLKKML